MDPIITTAKRVVIAISTELLQSSVTTTLDDSDVPRRSYTVVVRAHITDQPVSIAMHSVISIINLLIGTLMALVLYFKLMVVKSQCC